MDRACRVVGSAPASSMRNHRLRSSQPPGKFPVKTLAALVAITALSSAAHAQQSTQVVVSETDVWPLAGQISFISPDSGCRFVGTITEGQTAYETKAVITWSLQINAKVCDGVRTPVEARIFPILPSSVRASGPLLSAGQQAVLQTSN